jgi:regulator of protease activity HflC (stomatin/prohibitin superfamily)
MKHLLNLSSEQIEAIKTIRNSYKEQMIKERENIRRAKQTFRRTAESSNDVAAIHTAYAPVAEAMKNMAVSRILMKKEIDNVLTAQQIEKAQAVRAELLKNKPKHPPIGRPEWE